MAKNETIIIPINCEKTHETFYARYDYAYDGVWVLSYGLKTLPSDINNNFDDSSSVYKIDISNARTGPQYKCPYCGNTGFIRCGKCGGKFTCFSGEGDEAYCDHCKETRKISGTIDNIEGNRGGSQN